MNVFFLSLAVAPLKAVSAKPLFVYCSFHLLWIDPAILGDQPQIKEKQMLIFSAPHNFAFKNLDKSDYFIL